MRPLAGTTWLGLLLAGLTLTGGRAAAQDNPTDLKVGDVAPAFEAVDDQGRTWKSVDHVGRKYVVVYFYPGDFTPGCTRQADSFRDTMNRLSDQGVEVVGVSGDAAATHALFRQARKLNFTLLADEDGSLARRFGVPVGAGGQVKVKDADGKDVVLRRNVTAARWTFVLGKDGTVLYKNTRVNPAEDSKQIADFIDRLEKK